MSLLQPRFVGTETNLSFQLVSVGFLAYPLSAWEIGGSNWRILDLIYAQLVFGDGAHIPNKNNSRLFLLQSIES